MTDKGYQPKGHHPGLSKVPSNPKWHAELRLGDKLLWSPTLRAGGFASGETVVKSREFRDQLLGNPERTDILAIEMESVGFIKALEAGGRLKSGVVIKAIVDYCDENKSDHWHRAGAAIAADVLKHLLTYDLLPKP